MPIARVDYDDVVRFKISVDNERDGASELIRVANECVASAIQSIDDEISRLSIGIAECDEVKRNAATKRASMQQELECMERQKNNTPQMTTEEEACGTDEAGNTVYIEVERPNPEYTRLSKEIYWKTAQISRLDYLVGRVENDIESLEAAKAIRETAKNDIVAEKEALCENCQRIIEKSNRASEGLERAKRAIEAYNTVRISLHSVPGHSSISLPGGGFSPVSPTPDRRPINRNNGGKSSIDKDYKPDNHDPNSEEILYPLRWRKIKSDHDTYQDLRATNPNYSKGGEWRVNCQRCVPTFEMRKRGFNVVATPKSGNNDYISHHPFEVWKNPDVQNTTGSGMEDIRQAMSKWGDGTRAQIVVVWRGTNKGHTFIAEQINGETRFIDPQSSSGDVSRYFNAVQSGRTRFCRIDDLKPSRLIKECCKEADK